LNLVLKLVSICGLILTLGPSILVFNQQVSWQWHSNAMTVGMVLWFASAPFWMKTKGGAE